MEEEGVSRGGGAGSVLFLPFQLVQHAGQVTEGGEGGSNPQQGGGGGGTTPKLHSRSQGEAARERLGYGCGESGHTRTKNRGPVTSTHARCFPFEEGRDGGGRVAGYSALL